MVEFVYGRVLLEVKTPKSPVGRQSVTGDGLDGWYVSIVGTYQRCRNPCWVELPWVTLGWVNGIGGCLTPIQGAETQVRLG